MFHKKVNPNYNLKRNFFLPLEHDCSSRGSRVPREDPSPEASSSFFPLHDTLFTSEDSSMTPKSNLVHYVGIGTVENRNFAHTAQTDFPKKEGTWISIQRDGNSNSNRTTDSRDENDESKKSYCKEYLHHSKKFSSSKKKNNLESIRLSKTSFTLNLEDEDVIECDFNDKVPCCIDLLSGATLEKSSLTLNELNIKLFDTLHRFRVSKDNPEEKLVEMILPNCVTLLDIFDESELSSSCCDDIFESSTFLNTIEHIVHDIWVETLTENLTLFPTFNSYLELYKDRYMICKVKDRRTSTNIVEILESFKHFPTSVLETFRLGIKSTGKDLWHTESAIMNYIIFNRTFCTIILEIRKCFILIIRFMHSADLLRIFSNQVFLSFIDVLVKIVFECQIPQLFLGINEVVELWLQGDETGREQLLRAWCDAIVGSTNAVESRDTPNLESESFTSSTDEGEDSLKFNKWDVIEPFIDNIRAACSRQQLQSAKLQQ
ncbi:Spo77p [Saccharomyces eubayanus]|uniref:Spo77p n=1 Tax=Saccharomyces eubayanus TaxID=1080349 RepID=UPI0006C3B562|nr:SPO77-like protein [Saccharomyces eubayanus]KOG98015.1 SPO77-like protein [Saccharomyces eubayanus]